MNLADAHIREQALDPVRSFIVEAPAGSGKTELLVRRFLSLLQTVENPESVLAITFTRKAAAEMKERVIKALPDAGPFLEEKLNILTIDAFCYRVATLMPLESRLLGRKMLEDESALCADLLGSLLDAIESEAEGSEDLIKLFQYFDNQLPETVARLLALLRNREEWLPIVLMARQDGIDLLLKKALAALYEEALSELYAIPESALILPRELREHSHKEIIHFLREQTALFFTKQFTLRKRVDIALKPALEVLECHESLQTLLIRIAHLPEPDFNAQPILSVLLRVLPLAAAHLKILLEARNETDFHEIALTALTLLQDEGQGLLRKLDAEIRHILVDEFQDTSNLQFQLLQLLTQDWQEGDGRTLFLVGDPKQSIYRFRNAEVGLFLEAKHKGIGHLQLESLQLTQNFRTQAPLLEWINQTCMSFFPREEDEHLGKVIYTASVAIKTGDSALQKPVQQTTFEDETHEAEWIADQIMALREISQDETMAILVRSRSHYQAIITALDTRGLAYSVREDSRWLNSVFLDDLIHLLYALNHPGDRLSWFALLRSPFCNVSLQELYRLTETDMPPWHLVPALAPFVEGDLARLDLYEKFRRASDILIPQELSAESGLILQRFLHFLLNVKILPSQSALRAALARHDYGTIETSATIEFLTIHQAKGLEFDHVFLPALHRRVAADDAPLLYTETFYYHKTFYFLLAERKSRGGEASGLYRYIDWLEGEKARFEAMRLFYVALTRAKKKLFLSAVVKTDAEKKPSVPKSSFLGLLSV